MKWCVNLSTRELYNRKGLRVDTGGVKEFNYSKEDLKRIESEDTESTKEFKESYRKWIEDKHYRSYSHESDYKEKFKESYNRWRGNKFHRPHHSSKRYKDYREQYSYEPKKNHSFFKIIIFILIMIIILFLLYKAFFFIKQYISNEEKNEDKLLYEIEYVPVSFNEYLTNIDEYEGKEVTISGFIYQTTEKRGNYNYYVEKIVDDLDNEIKLSKTDSAIGKENIIENTFVNVTGILKKRPSKIDLEVSRIVITSRPTRLVEKKIKIPEPKPEEEKPKLGETSKNKINTTLNNLKETVYDLGGKTKEVITTETEEISNSIKEYEVESQLKEEERNKRMNMEAFDYVNELRADNDRNPLEWDDNIYELAVARSKDMYDKNYFDHVTPEGLCVKDFRADYGLQGYDLAENVAAEYTGYSEYDMHFSSYTDPKERIDGWMNSRGHRYNLLYASHIKGAVGCYRGVCTFLGANHDGFGSSPCTTGKEGLAFWETASKAPGEI
jgi:uncharacterized protein YkwD